MTGSVSPANLHIHLVERVSKLRFSVTKPEVVVMCHPMFPLIPLEFL